VKIPVAFLRKTMIKKQNKSMVETIAIALIVLFLFSPSVSSLFSQIISVGSDAPSKSSSTPRRYLSSG